MTSRRDARRCALQCLYQFDAGSEPGDDVRRSLEVSPGTAEDHEQGYALAVSAWSRRAEADTAVAALTPEWPTYRQPVVDRSILRLALYEMVHEDTPPKVAINEAIELAREYSTEKSHLFINAVLDRIFKSDIRVHGAEPDATAEGTG